VRRVLLKIIVEVNHTLPSGVDDGEMVVATTIYTCGPAALATILKIWEYIPPKGNYQN